MQMLAAGRTHQALCALVVGCALLQLAIVVQAAGCMSSALLLSAAGGTLLWCHSLLCGKLHRAASIPVRSATRTTSCWVAAVAGPG
jgi:hypothetical protein